MKAFEGENVFATRARIATDKRVGAGTLLAALIEEGANLDTELVSLSPPWKAPNGECFETLSVRRLVDLVDLCARWYSKKGIRPRDPVAIWSRDAGTVAAHYFALTRLGAIPALVNARLSTEDAGAYVERIRAVGVIADPQLLQNGRLDVAAVPSLRFIVPVDSVTADESDALPSWYPYSHTNDDPVLITHSSGTTASPKAVVMTHGTLFAAVRYRLRLPPLSGFERILSALPPTHNSAITLLLTALSQSVPIRLLSSGDAMTVVREIETFEPSFVAGFATTFADLAEFDFRGRDLPTVALWWNSGDAAHEAHVRPLLALGSHVEVTRTGRHRLPGSLFVDGLGSSEMGYSLFYNVHGREPDMFRRCIGRPYPFVEAAVLSNRGDNLSAYEVGMLGVKSPTLTPGYWNDSVTTYRSRLQGYWLTGDLVYRDDQGRFFHVDRWSDAIPTAEGVVYSLLAEELILAKYPEVRECAVVGVAGSDGRPEAWVLLVPRVNGTIEDESWPETIRTFLCDNGVPQIRRVKLVSIEDLKVGPTGKVKKRVLREWLGASDAGPNPINIVGGVYA